MPFQMQQYVHPNCKHPSLAWAAEAFPANMGKNYNSPTSAHSN